MIQVIFSTYFLTWVYSRLAKFVLEQARLGSPESQDLSLITWWGVSGTIQLHVKETSKIWRRYLPGRCFDVFGQIIATSYDQKPKNGGEK